MSCPIGFAKGEQKYELCYASIVNLAPRMRNHMDNILLVEATNAKAFKKYGAARIVSGVDTQGEQVDEQNFAADMRRLKEGIEIDIPKPEGGTRKIRLQAWVVALSADFPAAGALLPCMESTSAHHWCRECDADFSKSEASRPFVFAEQARQRKRGHGDDSGCCAPGRLRSASQLRAEIRRLRDLRKRGKSVAKEMQQVSNLS